MNRTGQTQPTSSSPGGTKSNAWSSVVPADWQGRFRQWQQWASQMFEVVAPIDHLNMNVCHKLRRKPGGPAPRWTQMPRKSTDSQKRFLIGAFEWIRISGCCYCWHKMQLSNSDIAGQTLFFPSRGVWYVLQNWFFIRILCFNLSMGKTPPQVSWIVRIIVVNDEDV